MSTDPRIFPHPLSPTDAWAQVQDWVSCEVSWVPVETSRHAEVLGGLLTRYQLRGRLVPDARLAALAIEHGLTVCSADSDFARFAEVRWHNPLSTP